MTTKTEKLLNQLNQLRGKEYPDKGRERCESIRTCIRLEGGEPLY